MGNLFNYTTPDFKNERCSNCYNLRREPYYSTPYCNLDSKCVNEDDVCGYWDGELIEEEEE